MKPITAISTVVLVALIMGCGGDNGATGPDGGDPPKPGYVWEVWEQYVEDGYWYPPLVSVVSYDSSNGEKLRDVRAPFEGSGYDAAYGEGRLWVAGGDYYSGPVIWEVGVDCYPSPGFRGLTWDGERLWGCNWGNFYTINPDTHESELMFTYGDNEYSFTGLAWDGEYLWAITHTTNEIIQIDPGNGSKVRSVPFPEPKHYQFEYNYGLTWDGEALLMSDPTLDGSIYRISPEDGTVLWILYTGRKSPYYGSCGLAFEPVD